MSVADQLAAIDAGSPSYATDFVDHLLEAATTLGFSDIHLQPEPDGVTVRCRQDGVLQQLGTFSRGEKSDIVTRLKVMAGLLTYQTDVPQEGRLRQASMGTEMRISTMPTVFGERAVVRLFGAFEDLQRLSQLGFPDLVETQLRQSLAETSGAFLITGPAGSGKTTTAYACLRAIVADSGGGRSILSLEDPVEVVVPGVSQSQSKAAAGFDLVTGLKAMLRQDPEVIFIGEIRDRETAEIAFQAALTGQLVLSTFHAGSAAEAVRRLVEMDIEPYILRSALLGIVSQRLVRRLCECSRTTREPHALLGLDVPAGKLAEGCVKCNHTGYQGRTLLTEVLSAQNKAMAAAILDPHAMDSLETVAADSGMVTLAERALHFVQEGVTSPQEVRRVMGWREGPT